MVTLTQQQSSTQPEVRQTVHYQIVIIGGGAAGITTASLLLGKNPQLGKNVFQ